MYIRTLTLETFRDFVLENIFTEINFQYDEKHYKKLFEDKEEIEKVFSFKRITNLKGRYPNVTFRLGIVKEELDEISFFDVRALFDNLIKILKQKGLQDLETHNISFSYYSTQDYEFELNLALWIKKE